MKPCGDKLCKRAGMELPLSEFPRNRSRKDGRNFYCRQCCRRQNKESRDRKREQRVAFEVYQPKLERKPNMISPIVQVRQAIARGERTREAIKISTQLDFECIADVLAELWDSGQVRVKRVNGDAIFEPAA